MRVDGSRTGARIAKAVGSAVLAVWFVLTIAFIIFRGSQPVASLLLGEGLTPAQIEQLIQDLGLERSKLGQYIDFIGESIGGEFGISLETGESVSDLIVPAALRSGLLGLTGMLVAIALARFVAVASARTPNSLFDRAVVGASTALASVPFQYYAVALLLLGAITLRWFPSSGDRSFRSDSTGLAAFLDILGHAILPVLSLAPVLFGEYTLIARARVLDELERAGARPRSLLARRRAFNATVGSDLRSIAQSLGLVLTGVVVTEIVYARPGLGSMLASAFAGSDYAVLQGVFIALGVPAVALAALVRARWPIIGSTPRIRDAPADVAAVSQSEAPPPGTSGPRTPRWNRAVVIGVVVAGIWVVLTLSTLVQPQGPTSAGWVADLRADRALLRTMLWTAAFAVVLGGVLGAVPAAAPKLLATPAAWVTDMFAAMPMILVPFLAVTPFGSGGIRVALGLVGAARVARPVARSIAERDGRVGWARLLARPLAAGAASVASFTAFVVSVIGLVAAAVAQEVRWLGIPLLAPLLGDRGRGLLEISFNGPWIVLIGLALNAAAPILGFRLISRGLSSRTRSFAEPAAPG